MEVVASLSQGRTTAAQCGLFTYKSVPVIFEPPCISIETGHHQAFSTKLQEIWQNVVICEISHMLQYVLQ